MEYKDVRQAKRDLPANENKRSTGPEDGSGVLYFRNKCLTVGY